MRLSLHLVHLPNNTMFALFLFLFSHWPQRSTNRRERAFGIAKAVRVDIPTVFKRTWVAVSRSWVKTRYDLFRLALQLLRCRSVLRASLCFWTCNLNVHIEAHTTAFMPPLSDCVCALPCINLRSVVVCIVYVALICKV